METYEQLLTEAYKNVKQTCSACERFEIKKAEGHIEGNRTIITNFLQIASCLRRKPEHLLKFLLKELATAGDIVGDRLILIKKSPSQIINQKIEKYAQEYVTCSNCKKPDTEIIEENNKKYIKCLACGAKKQVV